MPTNCYKITQRGSGGAAGEQGRPGVSDHCSWGKGEGFAVLFCPVLLCEIFRNRELRKHTSTVTHEGEQTLNASDVCLNFSVRWLVTLLPRRPRTDCREPAGVAQRSAP